MMSVLVWTTEDEPWDDPQCTFGPYEHVAIEARRILCDDVEKFAHSGDYWLHDDVMYPDGAPMWITRVSVMVVP